MTDLLYSSWVWLAAALALGILEVLAPGFVFLGFAIGAALMAGLVAIPMALSPTVLVAVFALLSLVAWLVMRRVFRARNDQTRIIHDDIND